MKWRERWKRTHREPGQVEAGQKADQQMDHGGYREKRETV